MRSLNKAPVFHRGKNAGRADIIPEHIDRLLAAADEGDQACVHETCAETGRSPRRRSALKTSSRFASGPSR